MTILTTKQIRDQIGINTFEKAIIFSASLLLGVKQIIDEFDTYSDIYLDYSNLKIIIQISLDYSPNLWISGGDLYQGVKELSNLAVEYTGKMSPSVGIENEPSKVNSLEKYFVWSCEKLLENYLKRTPEKAKEINFELDNNKKKINISLSLYFNPKQYLETNSLLIDFLSEESFSSLVGNDILFGNDFLLSN
jgi:hypothetical protein